MKTYITYFLNFFKKPQFQNVSLVGLNKNDKQYLQLFILTKGCLWLYVNDCLVSKNSKILCTHYKTTSTVKVRARGIFFSKTSLIPVEANLLETNFYFLNACIENEKKLILKKSTSLIKNIKSNLLIKRRSSINSVLQLENKKMEKIKNAPVLLKKNYTSLTITNQQL